MTLAGECHFAGEYTTGFFFLLARTGQRTDGGGNHRAVIISVELLAAGVQQAAVVVLQDREELAEFPGVPDAEAVEGLDHDRIDLASLDGLQEPLEIGPLVGFVPDSWSSSQWSMRMLGTLDVFPLPKRVLGIGGTSQITDCGHWAISLSIGSIITRANVLANAVSDDLKWPP